jgi:hypothetical protein
MTYPKYIVDKVASVLYEDARCGFFHDNMIRSSIYFHESNHVLLFFVPMKNNKPNFRENILAIHISPRLLLDAIGDYFDEDISLLRNRKNNELFGEFFKTI